MPSGWTAEYILDVQKDYDGFFERLVRSLLAMRDTAPRSKKIVVTAGPYRPSAVSYHWDEETKTMYLDFYSALRTGFGSLSHEDKQSLADLL